MYMLFFVRKMWRKFLIIHGVFFHFFMLLLTAILFPLLFLYSLCVCGKEDGYYIGIQELCGNIASVAQALREKGYKNISSLAIANRFNMNNIYDHRVFVPSSIVKFYSFTEIYFFPIFLFYFLKFIATKKHFIFFWNRSFLPFNLDLILLKLARKKVIIFHCGDDVRYRPIHNKMMKNEGVEYEFPLLDDASPNLTFLKKFFLQKFPSFLKIPIYTLMDIETFMDEPHYQFRVPQISHLPCELKKENEIPIIIHAPSNRALKGTKIVLKAIELLRSEGNRFKFIMLENMVNEVVIKTLESVDIVIDQPGLWGGRLAMEGMSHSCVVLGGNNSSYEKGSINLPIIEFKIDSSGRKLYEKLKFVLEKNNLEIMKLKFYRAYQDFYSVDAFVNHLIGVFNGVIQPDLFPLPEYKRKLLEASENAFQRLIIKIFLKD